ncbi:MAG: transglutaminase family protein [Acidimicrobiales bacterium]|nr:transglutaminase family protein [Acidimicrobiales bacterium]
MMYEVTHVTRYDYDAPVTASYAQVHQLPDDVDGQVCLRRSVHTAPSPHHQRERRDWFGNLAAVVEIHEPHTTLVVTSTSVVDTTGRPTELGDVARQPWEHHLATHRHAGDLDAVEFCLDSPLVRRSEDLADYARPSLRPGASLAEVVTDLYRRIHTDFVFDPEATETDTPLATVLELRRGVCQDFAHVLIGCLRSAGLAACYISGYLETDPPPGKPRLTGADRTHAWVGVHLGGDRWISVDPTNAQVAGPRYVSAARGRDYGDVPPLKGVIFTDAESSVLTVSVDVLAASPDSP